MPLIGYYRGRDRTDTIFGQEYVLTDLPLGINAGAPVTFSGSNQDADTPTTLAALAHPIFSYSTASTEDVNVPVNGAGASAHVIFSYSTALAEDVNVPLSLVGNA